VQTNKIARFQLEIDFYCFKNGLTHNGRDANMIYK
jgi:hypothetical protein